MSVLDRTALEASPLADLHAIASELSIDGYRRLRREALIDTILAKQSGEDVSVPDAPAAEEEPAKPKRRARARRTAEPEPAEEEEKPKPRSRARKPKAEPAAEAPAEAVEAPEADEDDDAPDASPRRRGRRGGRGRGRSGAAGPDQDAETRDADDGEEETEDGQLVDGVVELLSGGSGFVRVDPPEPSDDDVYVSSAQVKRCELVTGDRVSGPKRAPRRSERFASMIRIETINGRPASELADSVRFDDLPAAFPEERIELASGDATLKAIEFLAPFGKGSRVTIVGDARAGKSHALRALAGTLAAVEGLTVNLVLAGARPEEITELSGETPAPAASAALGAPTDVQDGVVEPVIDQARRLAARGSDAVVLIDTLDALSPQLARKALGSARNIIDGGSLTVIGTSSAPVGGETTVIALDAARTAAGRFPAVDALASGTIRPERLVGEAGAEALARARAEAVDSVGR